MEVLLICICLLVIVAVFWGIKGTVNNKKRHIEKKAKLFGYDLKFDD